MILAIQTPSALVILIIIIGLYLYGYFRVAINIKNAGQELMNNALEKAGKIMLILIIASIFFTVIGVLFTVLSFS